MRTTEIEIPVKACIEVEVKTKGVFRWVALLGSWAFVAGLALLAMCCAPALSRIPAQPDQMSRAVELRVVCGSFANLLSDKPGKIGIAQGSGSGVVVGPHKILTASHVPTCNDTGDVSMTWARLGGAWVPVTVARSYMPERDIAELYVPVNTGFAPIAYRGSVMEHESLCAAFAFPMPHYDCGSFKGYREPVGGIEGILAIPVVAGNSGSGLFDRQGALVGIIAAQALCHVEVSITIDDEGQIVPEVDAVGGPDCDGYASMLGTVVQP